MADINKMINVTRRNRQIVAVAITKIRDAKNTLLRVYATIGKISPRNKYEIFKLQEKEIEHNEKHENKILKRKLQV